MKIKVEQRKKGDKPPFLRNTVQGKTTLKEPIMLEIMGKNPWQHYIQCESCGRYNIHRDFPQRGDKERIVHIV
jgi:hypothetical protein